MKLGNWKFQFPISRFWKLEIGKCPISKLEIGYFQIGNWKLKNFQILEIEKCPISNFQILEIENFQFPGIWKMELEIGFWKLESGNWNFQLDLRATTCETTATTQTNLIKQQQQPPPTSRVVSKPAPSLIFSSNFQVLIQFVNNNLLLLLDLN